MRPKFPPVVNWRGYGAQVAVGMVAVAAIVVWLFLTAELGRLHRGVGSSGVAVAVVLLGVAVILLAAYAAYEHRRADGWGDVHEARASAAWYALGLPISVLLLAVAWWTLPMSYPPADPRVSGPVTTFAIDRPSAGEIDLRIGVNGRPPVYRYRCDYVRRTGWCTFHPEIMSLALAGRPRQASLVSIGQDLVMLRMDGRTVIDWEREHSRRLRLGLAMLLLGGSGLVICLWGAFVYARWARELSQAPSQTDGQPNS